MNFSILNKTNIILGVAVKNIPPLGNESPPW